jgi:hypothetical protein
MCGNHPFGCFGFGDRSFDNRVCFLLGLSSGRLRGCCSFGVRFLSPDRLPGCGYFRLLRGFRDRLR